MATNETSRHGIRWAEVAEAMGANLVSATRDEATIALRHHDRERQIILSDNGGEVNVSEIVTVLPYSVPYRAGEKRVGPFTLANRLLTALDGEPIDYAFRVDEDETTHAEGR